MTPTPIKMPMLEREAMIFERGDHACRNIEEYFDVVSHELSVGGSFSIEEYRGNSQLILSEGYKREVSKHEKLNFETRQEMKEYLLENDMLDVTEMQLTQNLSYWNEQFADTFTGVRYTVYGGLVYITVDPPASYYYESQQGIFYLFVRSQLLNHYYLFIDSVFEDFATPESLISDYMSQVEAKPIKQILTNNKRGLVVTIPTFQKTANVALNKTDGLAYKCSLVWKEYLKGVREIEEENILAEAIAPFYTGVIAVAEDRLYLKFLALIEEKDELKH